MLNKETLPKTGKSNLLMDFSVNRENHSITVKREFAAELPLVWSAFTQSEILDQWWAPRPWKARTKTMSFTEGGFWHYAMVGPEGGEHWALAKYLTIQNQKGFSALDAFADADGNINPEMPQSKWESTFTAGEDATLVVFQITFSDLAQLETTIEMGFKEGLTAAMEGLDEIFALKAK
ncbi:MAG: SRPBCC domain-containing protein [Bacteroidia bacterium]|nr:SRPBCC domain-containing protein [Bacteroidia bacterium]